MKKILLIILIGFYLFSCQKDNTKLKEPFLGTWNNFPDNLNNQVQFYKDSVVLWDLCRKSSATWKVDHEKIYFQYIKVPPDTQENHWYLNYKLNSAKDSLTLIHENDSTEILMQKISNNWEHYLKGYDLHLEITEATPLQSFQKRNNNNFPTLFIGWRDSILTVKGENRMKILKTSKDYFQSLMMFHNQTELERNMLPVFLVTDKNVSEKQIDSIKEIVANLNVEKTHFFRIYSIDFTETYYGRINPDCIENDYDWYWYGQWED